MDMMTIRKMVMAQMAGALQIKRGTFTGAGSTNAAINIGFKPDIVVITRDLTTEVVGMQTVVIVRGRAVYNSLYYTVSGVPKIGSYDNNISVNEDEWGYKEQLNAYVSYATFLNDELSLGNQSTGGRCYFINNDTYSWTAIKL